MLKLSILLYLLGSAIVIQHPGRFDYEDFNKHDLVFDGIVHECDNDSLTVEVLQTWTGYADIGNQIDLSNRYGISLSYGDSVLLMVDSTGTLSSYGYIEDGYYRMSPGSSPDLLSIDDLSILVSGETPELNNHESFLTVHFPVSGEIAYIAVSPTDEGRRAQSDIRFWNDTDPEGNIMNQRGIVATKLTLLPVDSESWGLSNLGSFQGSLLRFDRGTYFFEMWPLNPCFPSIDALEDYYLEGIEPTYIFRIETGDIDHWEIGLSDPAFLVSEGSRYWITGRQQSVRDYTTSQWGDNELCFAAFSGGIPSSPRRTLLRLSLDNNGSGRPMLASMLELESMGSLRGSLLYLESTDEDPVEYCSCALSLYSPRFELKATLDPSSDVSLDGFTLCFTETGKGVLENGGTAFAQTPRPAELPYPLNTDLRYTTVAAFEYPSGGTGRLILHFSNSEILTDALSLMPRLFCASLREDSLVGNIFLYDADSVNAVDIGEFIMHLK